MHDAARVSREDRDHENAAPYLARFRRASPIRKAVKSDQGSLKAMETFSKITSRRLHFERYLSAALGCSQQRPQIEFVSDELMY